MWLSLLICRVPIDASVLFFRYSILGTGINQQKSANLSSLKLCLLFWSDPPFSFMFPFIGYEKAGVITILDLLILATAARYSLKTDFAQRELSLVAPRLHRFY